jgi:hypothetical protein
LVVKQTVIGIARELLERGLARSVDALLATRPETGYELGELRRLARHLCATQPCPAGIYALVVHGDLGLVVPVLAEPGCDSLPIFDEVARQAHEHAEAAVGRLLPDRPRPPRLRLDVPSGLTVEGASLGLAGALAFAARLSALEATVPVLASGQVRQSGQVLPVSGIEPKLVAARRELAGGAGLVLVAQGQTLAKELVDGLNVREVSTVTEAITAVFGSVALQVTGDLLSVEALLDESAREPDHRRAIERLRSRHPEDVAEPERVRLLAELGKRLRHLGADDESARVFAQVSAALPRVRAHLGPNVIEQIEMEAFATQLDIFRLAEFSAVLEQRLGQPFHVTHNRVRCQGMLAQVLSMQGLHEQALALRQDNLRLQKESEAMREEMPRTACHAMHEAALAVNCEAFERFAAWRFALPSNGDQQQARFDAASVLRGLVAFSKHALALPWATGALPLWQRRAARSTVALVKESRAVSTYPEVTTMRLLGRALRRCGQPQDALALLQRVDRKAKEPLMRWVCGLVDIEVGLAILQLGDETQAQGRLQRAADFLRTAHAPASSFHQKLLLAATADHLDPAKIEAELDRVYY